MRKTIDIIGIIETPFEEKFGVPRQSGMIDKIMSTITLLPKYSPPDAVRGLDGFSHIWVIWGFSENNEREWSPTVRPPRLGGNIRKGVFATRSPNRPNPLGLSSLKLHKIEYTEKSIKLTVSGADMVNGTPIYDIKPYISFTDSHPDANGGYSDENWDYKLKVVFSEEAELVLPKETKNALEECLSDDPRPSYHNDDREYHMLYADYDVTFNVKDDVLTVTKIKEGAN